MRRYPEVSFPKRKSDRSVILNQRKIAFVIHAENRPDVLARVVMLFHRLNVEILGIRMERKTSAKRMGLSVRVQGEAESSRRLEAQLCKVVHVHSVHTSVGARRIGRSTP